MAQQITTTSAISPRPAHQSREDATLLRAYTSRLETHPVGKCSISDQLAPTHTDRQRLTERRGVLVDGLAPARSSAAAASRIGEMFRAYPMVNMPEDKTRQVLAAYVAQVQHLPLWAIEAGCNSSIARDLPFPPSAGELRAACERSVQPIRDEEAEIRKVLDAEVYHSRPEAERERVKAGFVNFLRAM